MPRFIRENKKGWRLAASISCPDCGNRLYGDKEYAWCKSYDCTFFCQWSQVHSLYNGRHYLHTEKLKGALKQIGEHVYVFWDGDKNYKIHLEEIKTECQEK